MIDSSQVKKFWDAQAGKIKDLPPESIANLEENPGLLKEKVRLETEKVMGIVGIQADHRVLDLGSGVGQWAFRFAPLAGFVVAVEYAEGMQAIAERHAEKHGIRNIRFVTMPAQDYVAAETYDLIWISGLLIYLSDDEVRLLVSHCEKMLAKGGIIVVRDATGILGPYEINDRYSEALRSTYSALYRTREQYFALFEEFGLSCTHDEDMFPEGSGLNKWKETRLRVYRFHNA